MRSVRWTLAACAVVHAATAFAAEGGAAPFDIGGLSQKVQVKPEAARKLWTRTRISLDGDWLLQPVFPETSDEFAKLEGDSVRWPETVLPVRENWLLTNVPGNWRKELRSPDGKAVREIGSARRAIGDYTAAWYVKEVQLPPLKPGGKVLLSLDAVWGGIGGPFLSSFVYANGNPAGTITGWQRRRLDITGFAGGDRLQIAILNGTPGLGGRATLERMRESTKPAGIFQPVFIEVAEPTSLFVDEVLITPSVREKTLRTAVTVVSDAEQRVTFKARLFPVPMYEKRNVWPPESLLPLRAKDWRLDPVSVADEKPVAVLESGEAVSVAKGRSEVAVTFPSGQLELWSPAHPRLYWMAIETTDAGGKTLDTSVPVTFGFREMWTDGPDIILNGMKVNIFGSSHDYYGVYAWTPHDLACKHHLGFTMDRTMSPWWRAYEHSADAPLLSDRWGHFFSCAIAKTKVMHRYLNNHPSFVMWQYDGDGFVNGPHSHPMQIGDVQAAPAKDNPRYEQYAKIKEAYEGVKRLDPSRPIYFYRLGWGGDIRSIMAYLNANEPVSDMMDWPLAWYRNAKERKVEPFMPSEVRFTAALHNMFYWSAPGGRDGRLGHVEHAARFLGDEAYELVTPAEMLPEAYDDPWGPQYRSLSSSKLTARIFGYFYDRVFPAWRASGLSFLLHMDGKPSEHYEDFSKGVLSERGKSFRRVVAPLMACIAGPGDDFNAQDHAFAAGETVEKQLLLFNDTLRPAPVKMSVEIQATLDGKDVFAKTESVDVENGRRASVPIRFAIPDVAGRKAGTIRARVAAGDEVLDVREFAFQAFGVPRNGAAGGKEIVLIDPIGDTAGMLDKARAKYRKIAWDGDVGGADLLVIGRNACAGDAAAKLDSAGVGNLLKKGGNVIVFEQQARHVAGLANENFNIRHAFIRDRDNPLFEGMSNEDFAFWRGASDILEPYQRFEKAGFPWETKDYWAKHGLPNMWGQRRRFVPQWSNRNMVATFCYHKPQAGRFRVLLDCGFDNMFTPLVEFDSLGGKVLFCQLDVTNRYGGDPAITLLVDRMLKLYGGAKRREFRALAVFGSDDTRDLAGRLGFRMAAKDVAPEAGKHVAMVQPGAVAAEQAAKVAAFVRNGGTCVVLGAFEEKDMEDLKAAGLIGFDCALGTTDRIVLKDPPALLAGLGTSDFFYRRYMPGILAKGDAAGWTGAGGLATVAKVGEGSVVYLAVRPEVFQVDLRPDRPTWQETEVYWPTTKCYRILSSILSNAGAASDAPVDLKASKPSESVYIHRALDFDPMQSYTW